MNKLKKELSLYGLTMIAVGSCIGSGIFITPSSIAAQLPHPTMILGVWILGGIISITGALTYAELGGLFPKAGGVYVYLKEAYGDWMAFLYGWVIMTVITSGALAALSIAFARFLQFFIPIADVHLKWVGIASILILSFINIFGIKLGEWMTSIFTSLKLLGILVVVLIAAWAGSAEINFTSSTFLPSNQQVSFSAFGVALIGVLWSYGGWYHASYLAGEAKNPTRDVPKAIIYGSTIVMVGYILANVAYLYIMPIAEIQSSSAIAADSIARVFTFGAQFIAILIMVSVLGSIAIYTITAPRVYFAMAEDRVFFPAIAKLHSVYRTPVNAILLQAIWACVLIAFWGTFENLITYVVFMDWIFLILGAIGIFIFRNKIPATHRPYRTWGYPVVPAIFIIISIWFVYNTLAQKPSQAIAALVLLGLGLPLFAYFKHKHRR